ncbi:RNA-binding protein [Rhodotorula paludigena]|uniref:RNA-binding protein n=1 Tax=Rhodotorula paludigena TaxID=86838 RepID=UPI003175B326
MARSATPKGSKAAAAKASPAAAKATPPASTSASAKKRVRVVDDAAATPSKSTRSSKAANKAPAKAQDDAEEEDEAKGKNGVERKDLRDKLPGEVERIRSRDAPTPVKGALKRKAAGEDETEDKPAKAKGKGKGKKVEEEEEEVKLDDEEAEDDDEEDDDEEDDDEELDFLEGFESGEDDGEDSSDEEADAGEAGAGGAKGAKGAFKVEQLPKVKGESVQKKLEGQKKEKKAPKAGVVYLGRIPHGFYEDEMRSYFSQFGEVTRLRLSRNKQTGASKHYAFIEFKYESVAQIVHETMDNYLLAGHILVCKVIPEDQVHPKLWIGANRKFRVVPKARKDAARRNKPKTEKQQEAIKARLLSREEKKRKQLADLGIEYDFVGLAGQKAEEEQKAEPEAVVKGTPKAKKGRKSAGGDEPAKKKPRKSK